MIKAFCSVCKDDKGEPKFICNGSMLPAGAGQLILVEAPPKVFIGKNVLHNPKETVQKIFDLCPVCAGKAKEALGV